jgi:hypothetical protein
MRGSNPLAISTQPAFCLAVALIANSAALHGRCKLGASNGLNWRCVTLICNGSLLPGAECGMRSAGRS